MSDIEREWQRQDEEARMQQAIEALEKAERAGTPKDAIDILAYEAGIAEIYNRRKA